MPQRRPPHKTAHGLACPYGVFNWADCDAAAEHQWGQCKAMLDSKPEPCTRWAVAEEGYCGQHYAARIELERRTVRIAIERAALDARIDAYLARVAEHPSIWDGEHTPRGVAAGAGLEPATSRVTTDRSTTELPRKGPHRLTADEM